MEKGTIYRVKEHLMLEDVDNHSLHFLKENIEIVIFKKEHKIYNEMFNKSSLYVRYHIFHTVGNASLAINEEKLKELVEKKLITYY